MDMYQRLRFSLALFCLALIAGCGGSDACKHGMCFGKPLEIIERDYNEETLEFTITGEMDGNHLVYSFDLDKEHTFTSKSFGVQDASSASYDSYGAIKMIDFLDSGPLNIYYNEYVIPGKDCPASFMNRHLQNLVLVGATDDIHKQLQDFDIPFDGRGTDFEIDGHRMKYVSDRYMFNGENRKRQQILESTNISSNVGSAVRKGNYFLVTGLK